MSIDSAPRLPVFGIADDAGTGAVVAEVDGTSCFLLFESLALAERYRSEAEAGTIFRFDTAEELRGFTGGGTQVSQAMLNPTFRWTTGYMVSVAALL